jgi:cobalt-zinc-cadmium efflux system outer membrane protein
VDIRSGGKAMLGYRRPVTGFLLLLLASFPLWAGDGEVSLAQALEIFFAHNYDILVSRFEVDKASTDVVAAKLIPNPVLSFNYSSIYLEHERGIRVGDNTLWALRLDQLLEIGGKRALRTRTAEAALEAVRLSHEDTVRNLTAGFYTLYYAVLLDESNLDFSRQELGRIDRILDVSGKRYAAGALSRLDFSKLELSRVEVEDALINDEAQLRNDLEFFNVLLGGAGKLRPAPAEAAAPFAEYSEAALVQAACEKRADLLSLERQLAAAKNARRLARANGIPDLGIGAEYDSLGPSRQPAFGFGLSLNLPLFNRNQAEILKTGYVRDQLKVQVDKVKRQIEAEVRQALNNYQAAVRVLDTYRTHAKDMSDLLERTSQAFSRGGLTVLDFLDTQKTYRDFMSKYHQALTQSRLSQALLKLTAGETS